MNSSLNKLQSSFCQFHYSPFIKSCICSERSKSARKASFNLLEDLVSFENSDVFSMLFPPAFSKQVSRRINESDGKPRLAPLHYLIFNYQAQKTTIIWLPYNRGWQSCTPTKKCMLGKLAKVESTRVASS